MKAKIKVTDLKIPIGNELIAELPTGKISMERLDATLHRFPVKYMLKAKSTSDKEWWPFYIKRSLLNFECFTKQGSKIQGSCYFDGSKFNTVSGTGKIYFKGTNELTIQNPVK